MNSNMDNSVLKECAISSKHRRAAWFVAISVILLAGLQAYLMWNQLIDVKRESWSQLVCLWLSAFFCLVLLVLSYRWRIRVDLQGIARRRFVSWDCWKWEEFHRGEIVQEGSLFVSKRRPLWSRYLTLDYLEEEDKQFIYTLCVSELNRDAPPETSELLPEFTFDFIGAYIVSIRASGLTVKRFFSKQEFSWSEVKQVRMLYLDHLSNQLYKIEMELPHKTLHIEKVDALRDRPLRERLTRNKKLIPARMEKHFLAYVPPSILRRYALEGRPHSVDEYEYRKKALTSMLSGITWGARILPTLWFVGSMVAIGGPVILQLFRKPLGQLQWWEVVAFVCAALMMIAMPLVLWGVARFNLISLQQQLQELEKQRASLDSQS